MQQPLFPVGSRVIITKSNCLGRITEAKYDPILDNYLYFVDSLSVGYTERELEEVPADLLPEFLRLKAKLESIERQLDEIQTDLYDHQNSIFKRLELLEKLIHER